MNDELNELELDQITAGQNYLTEDQMNEIIKMCNYDYKKAQMIIDARNHEKVKNDILNSNRKSK